MRRILLFALLLLAGCGSWGRREEEPKPSSSGGLSGTGTAETAATSAGAVVATADAAVPGAGWVDPEPPQAHALAEQVVGAEWNQGRITHLTMSMTTLEKRTTGLQGFQTAVTPTATTLDERLSRLGAEVTGTEITIRLPGSVLFDFDSAHIRPDAERTLLDVAEVVKAQAGRPVRIEGHTDAVASDDYNQKLSERRAESVRAWLAAHGTDKARLTTRGHGETKPVADNATAEGRQRNRRVEVIIAKRS